MTPLCEIAFLGLGSNLGHRARSLSLAAMRLALAPGLELLRISPVYETAPWGVEEQPAFLNMVLAARSGLAPEELLATAKRIERDLGRQPAQPWGPRCIDIDILLHGDRRVATPDLVIPHPRLPQRQFALVPLAAIAPDALVAPGVMAADLARPDAPDITCLGPLAPLLRASRP